MAKYIEERDDGKGHKVTKVSHKNAFWIWIGALVLITVCVHNPVFIIPTVIIIVLYIIGKNAQQRGDK